MTPVAISGNSISRMMGSESVDESRPQITIDMQPSFVMSQGCTALGQQSWSPSDVDISAGAETVAPATGIHATESAIATANRVRAIAMIIT